MSWNSLRMDGSGLIIASKGKDPSHFSSKSKGSRCCEQVSDTECVASGYRFTYVVMTYESTQRQSVGLVVTVMKLASFVVRQTKLDKVC